MGRTGAALVAALCFLAAILGMAGLGGGRAGAAAPEGSAAPEAPAAAAPWERITLVVRPDPGGAGMAVLFLARWRGTGAEGASPPLALPALEFAEPVPPLPQGLRWEGGRLVDEEPPAPGEARDYSYVLTADTRATRGRLQVVLPAPVEQLTVLTVDGQLVATGEGLEPAGKVAGAGLGMPGVDLLAFVAGPVAGGRYPVTLMPPGMAGAGGATAGGVDAGTSAGLGAGSGTGGDAGQGAALPAAARWALGAGALMAAATAGAMVARYVNSPARWERRRRALIEAIVELDRAHAAGEVPEAVYESERRRLVAAAVTATRRWWQVTGAAPTAAVTEPKGPEPAGADRTSPVDDAGSEVAASGTAGPARRQLPAPAGSGEADPRAGDAGSPGARSAGARDVPLPAGGTASREVTPG
ncbi:hypothetical protein [Thermaerobacter marianensis]|nr:hypothetical protein [Thermaerobacter marianensis]